MWQGKTKRQMFITKCLFRLSKKRLDQHTWWIFHKMFFCCVGTNAIKKSSLPAPRRSIKKPRLTDCVCDDTHRNSLFSRHSHTSKHLNTSDPSEVCMRTLLKSSWMGTAGGVLYLNVCETREWKQTTKNNDRNAFGARWWTLGCLFTHFAGSAVFASFWRPILILLLVLPFFFQESRGEDFHGLDGC